MGFSDCVWFKYGQVRCGREGAFLELSQFRVNKKMVVIGDSNAKMGDWQINGVTSLYKFLE